MWMKWFLGTLIDAMVTIFNTIIPHGYSLEDMFKVYTPGGDLPYTNVKVYIPIGVFLDTMRSFMNLVDLPK